MKLTALLALAPLAQLCSAGLPATPISQLQKTIARSKAASQSSLQPRAADDKAFTYKVANLSVPVDHFHNVSKYAPHSNDHFNLRYWFDDTYYKAGGPVFVLSGGEIDASTRLPYLKQGILYILSKATGGMGVILEHRYYGTSFPTPNLSTENLRFLDVDQALADTAYFAQNVVFAGHKKQDTDPSCVPWIAYGGSYAGAFVSFLRKLYPDVYFGAIGSSGVPEAIWDYWRYYVQIENGGPPACIKSTQLVTDIVDKILIGCKGSAEVKNLKSLFGLEGIVYDNDFANILSSGITNWQSLNWDPAVSSPAFYEYCDALTNKTVTYPTTNRLIPQIQSTLNAAGYKNAPKEVLVAFQNYIGWINETETQPCLEGGQTTDECFTTHNATYYQQDDLESYSIRSWAYQYCTQFGFLQTGSGFPKDQKALVSRTIDLDYLSIICRDGFNITSPPDTDSINKYGGWGISYPRLALIDGEIDPWREAGPHAAQAPARNSTTAEPYILIKNAVHHWDENGLLPNETTPTLPPQPVKDTHQAEVNFVKAWLKDWKKPTHY